MTDLSIKKFNIWSSAWCCTPLILAQRGREGHRHRHKQRHRQRRGGEAERQRGGEAERQILECETSLLSSKNSQGCRETLSQEKQTKQKPKTETKIVRYRAGLVERLVSLHWERKRKESKIKKREVTEIIIKKKDKHKLSSRGDLKSVCLPQISFCPFSCSYFIFSQDPPNTSLHTYLLYFCYPLPSFP